MKTIDEVATELYPLRSIGGAAVFEQSAFKKGIAFANTWYPFKEYLPEHYVRVNVKDIHGDMISFKFTGHCDIKESAKAMGFTHWKPIIIK